MSYEFTIPGRLPGQNEIIKAAKGRGRGNFSLYAKLKREEQQEVLSAIELSGKPAAAFQEPVVIFFTFYEPNLRRDVDNIAGGAHKIILDALQAAGIIKNDSQRYVRGYMDNFRHDKENPRIEVVIEEAEQTSGSHIHKKQKQTY